MFKQDDLRELATYQAETPVLSVYLDVDPTKHTTDEYKLALRQLLKRVEGTAAPEDVAAVERFFDHEYDWSGRGVAVFSCNSEDFWRAYSLPVPVTSRATTARKPYVWPLAALVESPGAWPPDPHNFRLASPCPTQVLSAGPRPQPAHPRSRYRQ